MATTDIDPADAAMASPRTGRHAARRPARRWRDWLIPRSILGTVVVILAFAVGAAMSGVIFYSYYSSRLAKNEDFVSKFGTNYERAVENIDAEVTNGKADIEAALKPLREMQAGGGTITQLINQAGPAVWFIETQDDSGQPAVGSAFAVTSDSQKTLLVGSYATIKAATKSPGPKVYARKGEERYEVELHTWDEANDLALLTLGRADQPTLEFAPTEPALQPGQQLFAVSGLGSAKASVTQGFVSDVSAQGIQHNTIIGPQFQGGPLINADGEVLGIASRSYAPLGFRTDGIWFAPAIDAACLKILKCPDDGSPSAGAGR